MSTQEFLKDDDNYQYKRETIEQLIQDKYDYDPQTQFDKYQPVLYEIIKDPVELQKKESLV